MTKKEKEQYQKEYDAGEHMLTLEQYEKYVNKENRIAYKRRMIKSEINDHRLALKQLNVFENYCNNSRDCDYSTLFENLNNLEETT